MAKRISVALSFNGPDPLVINANGTVDKRLSVRNLMRLLGGIDSGAQYRGRGVGAPPALTVQESIVQATGTVTPAAVQAADTLTLAGTALTATQLRAKQTYTLTTAVVGNKATINGVDFVGVAGAAVLGEATFSVDTGDAAAAASLAAQINGYGGAAIKGVVEAKAAAAVCTVYAKSIGTGGNAITTTKTGAPIAVGGATLAGGAARANNQFDYIGTDAETGTDLAYAINNSTTAAVKRFTAAAASNGVVTLTAKAPGVAGNALTTVGTAVRLAAGAATLTGGSAGEPYVWTF